LILHVEFVALVVFLELIAVDCIGVADGLCDVGVYSILEVVGVQRGSIFGGSE